MARKIRRGDKVITGSTYQRRLAVVIDLLPKGKFYLAGEFVGERVVERKGFSLIPGKYRILGVGENTQNGDEILRGRNWYPISGFLSVNRIEIIRRLKGK